MKKDNNNVVSTRGKWKKRELVMAVLALLRAAQQQCVPGMTAQMIYIDTGCNRNSLYCHLSKWVKYSYITRRRINGLYHYFIAPKGHSYFEAITQGFLSRRKRQWIQINTLALLRRLPAYQRGISK